MPIKSFRGQIADGAIDTIVLHTNTGSTGYRIKKFQLMATDPATTNSESTVKVFTVPQTGTPTSTIDFSDNTLIAAGYVENDSSSNYLGGDIIFFDNVTFNQDIYLTCQNKSTADGVNYHIELEMVKLDLNENTVATLKDIRNIASQ